MQKLEQTGPAAKENFKSCESALRHQAKKICSSLTGTSSGTETKGTPEVDLSHGGSKVA